jgi:hypothetical protein
MAAGPDAPFGLWIRRQQLCITAAAYEIDTLCVE